MNRAVLVACGALVVACTGAWSQQPATPKAETIPAPTTYTVSKSASWSGHVKPGQTITYTVKVHANTDVADAVFKDDLSEVLDDAQYGEDVQAGGGSVSYAGGVVIWKGDLASGQSVQVSYSVRVDDPDRGNGLLRNDVEPGSGGECDSCAVTNAVAGAFTVAQSASPRPGSTVRPGDIVKYTVRATAGRDAPAYVSFTDSLSGNADYAGDAHASDKTPATQRHKVSWQGSLAAGKAVTVTFSARVTAGGTSQVTSTVRPVSNGPSSGSCATDGACQVSYRVLAPTGSNISTAPSATSGSATGSSRAAAAPEGPGPTTSVPRIAETGAQTAGLSRLALLLLLGGVGLLLLGLTPGRRPRHRH